MKNDLKISTLAIICVLCTAVSGAYGASSVRSLGGTGTYTSASSAAAAGDSTSSSSVRGGSVRVNPTSGMTGTSTSVSAGTTTSGRVATTPRLSIGQYLGGTTAVSGGSSLRPQTPSGGTSSSGGGDWDPEVTAAIRQEIDQLQRDVEDLRTADDNVQDQLLDKQDILTSRDDLVEIDQSSKEIFINTDNLAEVISEKLPSARPVEIQSDGSYIQWRYEGDSAWNNIVSLEDLRGPQGEPGESVSVDDVVNSIEDDLQAAVNDAVSAAVKDAVASEIENSDLVTSADLAGLATTEQLNAKADKATTLAGYGIRDAYKDTEVDSMLAGKEDVSNKTQQVDASSTQEQYPSASAVYQAIESATSGIATSDDIAQFQQDVSDLKTTVGDENSGLVKDVNDLTTSVGSKADSSTVSALETKVDGISDLATAAASAADSAVAGLSAKADKTELAGKEDVSNKKTTLTDSDTDYPSTSAVTAALANKADRAELSDLATKDEVSTAVSGAIAESGITELGQRVTDVEDTIGTGEFATTDKTVIGAINELKNKTDGIPTEGNFEEMNNKLTQMEQDLSGKQDVANMTNTLIDDATKYPTSAAVYTELETKAFKSDLDATNEALANKADKSELEGLATTEDLAGLATKEELANKADTSALETVTQNVTNITQQITDPETGLSAKVDSAVTAAGAAQTAAEEAKGLAETAQSTAETAQQTAESAKSTADAANTALAGKQDKLSYTPEDSANRATAINDGNKTSSTAYPSVGAVTEWTEQRISQLSTEGIPVNPDDIAAGSITEEKLSADSVSTVKIQDGAVTEEKLSEELQTTINNKVDADSLGSLAYENSVTNANIAADAGIEKSKLAADVQATLDNAVTTTDAGSNKILGTDESGAKVWYDIVFE